MKDEQTPGRAYGPPGQESWIRKRSRRSLVKGGVATVSGLVLSTTYVKPSLLTISLHETAYASGALRPNPPNPAVNVGPPTPTPIPTVPGQRPVMAPPVPPPVPPQVVAPEPLRGTPTPVKEPVRVNPPSQIAPPVR